MLYEFGSCALDTLKRQLSRAGQPVPLAPKTFDLLLLLAESGGRVLTKAELMQSLWPDTFVEEANLSFQISTLRKALGDEGAKWIETVPKHGYRFAGTVMPANPEAIARPAPRFSWALLPLLALALSAGFYFLKPRPAPTAAAPPRPIPLTAFPGTQTQPSLSPDGSQVAFSWNGSQGENFDIYVKLVGPGEPVRLTSHDAQDYCPAWSPDGRQIAFLRFLDRGRAALFVIPSLGGGLERRVADLQLPSIRYDSVMSWAPDSRHLVVGTRFREGEPWGIWLLPLDGAPPERLTTASNLLPFDAGPAFSPDGTSLAFIRVSAKNHNEIWVRNANGETRKAATENGAILSLAWVDNRRLLYTAGPGYGLGSIRSLDLNSDSTPGNPGFGESAVALSVARRGTLVYAREQHEVNLWRFDLAALSAPPRPLAPSTYQSWTPAYSPDGKRIAFASTRSGLEEIWVAEADGSHPMQVTRVGSGHTANPRWSPDGQSLLFNSWNPGSALYSLNLADASVKRLTQDSANHVEPSWSRDGKWIYFGSDRTGRLEIHRIPAGGGPIEQITRQGGLHAEESFDAKWLYYSKDEYLTTSIWKVPRDGGQETLLFEGVSYSLNFVPAEKGIYFISGQRSRHPHSAIEFYEFATGQRKVLATVDKAFSWGLTLSADGRSLLVPLLDRATSNLMLLDSFRLTSNIQ